jgi:hypothetical protein
VGKVWDLSRRGLGLVVDVCLQRGDILGVVLEGLPERLVRVRRTTAQPGDSWLAGCMFITELGKEELQAVLASARLPPATVPAEREQVSVPAPAPSVLGRDLRAASQRRGGCVPDRRVRPPGKVGRLQFGDPFLHGSSSEKRGSLRRGGTSVPVLLSDAEGKAKPVRGMIFDRSAGGLAVVVEEPVKLGTVLGVRVVAHPAMSWVPVKVRNFRREGSHYLLGCQFLRSQPWSIQLLFG